MDSLLPVAMPSAETFESLQQQLPTDIPTTDKHSSSGLLHVNQLEIDIGYAFDRHVSALFRKKCQIVDEITHWSGTIIHQIQEHAQCQRKLLDDEYDRQASHLSEQRELLIGRAQMQESRRGGGPVEQLLDQCNELKREFLSMERPFRQIQTIQLVKESERLMQNATEYNASNETVQSILADGGSHSPKPTWAMATQTE